MGGVTPPTPSGSPAKDANKEVVAVAANTSGQLNSLMQLTTLAQFAERAPQTFIKMAALNNTFLLALYKEAKDAQKPTLFELNINIDEMVQEAAKFAGVPVANLDNAAALKAIQHLQELTTQALADGNQMEALANVLTNKMIADAADKKDVSAGLNPKDTTTSNALVGYDRTKTNTSLIGFKLMLERVKYALEAAQLKQRQVFINIVVDPVANQMSFFKSAAQFKPQGINTSRGFNRYQLSQKDANQLAAKSIFVIQKEAVAGMEKQRTTDESLVVQTARVLQGTATAAARGVGGAILQQGAASLIQSASDLSVDALAALSKMGVQSFGSQILATLGGFVTSAPGSIGFDL